MKIDHIAIWTKNLEESKQFYLKYFNTTCGEKYHNPKKNFTSYFIAFAESTARLELMHKPDIEDLLNRQGDNIGLAHISISVGSKEKVDKLTGTLREDGYTIKGGPRTTGDGYYESVVLDPDGNIVEITE